jgi:hypothetical protein
MTVELSGRDLAIVQLVTRFKQVTTAHVYELLFTTASRSPCDIALHRLTKQCYLHRIERRAVGGRRGGSGQYVYALGRRGFFMSSVGNYRPARTVDYHALQIVETYLALQRLHVAGQLTIAGYSTEPDCWQTVGGMALKPDMYVELENPAGGRMGLWLEIDMGTEGQRQIRDKFMRYWRAYEAAEDWPVFRVVFIAIDQERAKELNWLLEQGSDEQRELFRVVTLPEFTALLTG